MYAAIFRLIKLLHTKLLQSALLDNRNSTKKMTASLGVTPKLLTYNYAILSKFGMHAAVIANNLLYKFIADPLTLL